MQILVSEEVFLAMLNLINYSIKIYNISINNKIMLTINKKLILFKII